MSPEYLAYRTVWVVFGLLSLAYGVLDHGSTVAFEDGPFVGSFGALAVLAVLLLPSAPRTLIGTALWVSLKLSCVVAAAFGVWWPLVLLLSPVLHGTVVFVAAVATFFMDEGMLPRWPPEAPTPAPPLD